MSEIIEKFEICSKISEDLKKKIKLFHVFDQGNVLFVTGDDEVYSFGPNGCGICGLGHTNAVNEPQIIPELCQKSIKQFFNGLKLMFALSQNKQLFGWGQNDRGKLGVGITETPISKPRLVKFPTDETIVQMSCNGVHTLALTVNGRVYGWGYVEYYKLDGEQNLGPNPMELKTVSKLSVKSVNSLNGHSFVVTTDGQVFGWGWNSNCVLGHELDHLQYLTQLKPINLSNVSSVCLSFTNTYFLTNEGLIYFCGKTGDSYQKIPKQIETDLRFNSLNSVRYYFDNKPIPVSINENGVFILDSNQIRETKYKTFFDFISNEHKMTDKTIEDKKNREILKISEINDNSSVESKFEAKFEILKDLGSGMYGQVFKVKDKTDQKIYAVKKILMKGIINKLN